MDFVRRSKFENWRILNMEQFEKLITDLSKRNMNGYFVEDRKKALEKGLSLIPNNSKIGFGGKRYFRGSRNSR